MEGILRVIVFLIIVGLTALCGTIALRRIHLAADRKQAKNIVKNGAT